MNQHGLTRLALPVLFFMSAFVGAAGAQEVKIGYVFTDEIREKASIFQRNQKRFEEQAQRLQDDIRNLDQEIKRLKTELETQSVWISSERREELAKEIEGKVAERDRLAGDIYKPKGRIDQLKQELTGPVVARMMEIIQKIGNEEGYSMIIDLSPGVVLYYQGLANLTQRVVEELNTAFAAETAGTSP